jgi:hypothetical protein
MNDQKKYIGQPYPIQKQINDASTEHAQFHQFGKFYAETREQSFAAGASWILQNESIMQQAGYVNKKLLQAAHDHIACLVKKYESDQTAY